ncbi:FAD-dependent monooxygenase [Streptomyces sp. NPDC001552]|uniref:FAD-dependent monooxygenase n=1 Tax=Streptomyces sp. NPDC001552 TaxID=3364587 RepID=UPI003687E1E1
MNNVDVLITGGGPTGLTLACDLARRGIRCRVIEQAPGPTEGSRGFTVKPRSLEIFDDLGIADRIVAASDIQSRTRFHLGTPLLFDMRVPPAPPTASRPYPNSVALPQWRTESILRDRLAELGGKVEFSRRLTDFTADGDGVTATVEDPNRGGTETVRANYLIGADGGRSQVRHTLGLLFSGATDEDTRALIADVRVDGLTDLDAVHLWMAANGHILVARPTPHAETWQVVASLQQDPSGQWPQPSLDTLQRAVIERTGRRDIRLADPAWLSVWRYNLRMVNTYRAGRVLLAGDAAHVHSPFGAHGMNTGIQDAYNLAWKLALVLQGVSAESLLDTYEDERLPVARAVLADSDRRFSAATPPRAVRPVVRFVVKSFLARQQRRDRNDHPTYRTGPLTTHLASRRSSLRAGDVAPDGPVQTVDAEARLFDILRGPQFTLLTFGTRLAPEILRAISGLEDHLHAYTVVPALDYSTAAGPTVLIDRTRRLFHVYGAREGTLVVIRPDGYIGLIAHRPTASTLRDYLHRMGIQLPQTEGDGAP